MCNLLLYLRELWKKYYIHSRTVFSRGGQKGWFPVGHRAHVASRSPPSPSTPACTATGKQGGSTSEGNAGVFPEQPTLRTAYTIWSHVQALVTSERVSGCRQHQCRSRPFLTKYSSTLANHSFGHLLQCSSLETMHVIKLLLNVPLTHPSQSLCMFDSFSEQRLVFLRKQTTTCFSSPLRQDDFWRIYFFFLLMIASFIRKKHFKTQNKRETRLGTHDIF